jgi:phasin family protein
MLTVEQVVAAQKSSFGTAFGATARAFEGFEKIVELNLQAARATLAEAAESAKAAFSVNDGQGFTALQGAAVQPGIEKLTAYSRQVYEIVAATNADIGKIAEEAAAEAQKAFATSFDLATKNAPAGAENAVAFVKSAVAAANNAYDAMQKAVKQAADVADANVEAAVSATKAGGSRKRAA